MRIGVGRRTIPCLLVPAMIFVLGGMRQVQAQTTPSVTCSVTTDVLSPPDNSLVNVGLSVTPSGFSGTVTYTLHVYSNRPERNDRDNDRDGGPLASWDGSDPTTLQLRANRGKGQFGRVYLIVVTATDGTDSASCACTVAVPHNESKRALARVTALAAWAENYAETNNFMPPPSFFQVL
jgi:hypothetical protein